MKIETRLKIAALAPVLMALAVAASILYSYKAVQISQDNYKTAQRIVRGVNELNSLAGENMLYHEERSRQQFLAEHELITHLLSSMQFHNIEQQQVLKTIRSNTDSMNDSFVRIASNYELLKQDKNHTPLREAEERLSGQLLVKSRQAVADGLRLERLVYDEMSSSLRALMSFILFFIVTLAILLVLALTKTMRRVTTALALLRKGTEVIGAGNLDHRIGMAAHDEIGELAGAFDRMTEQLQAVTVSKEALLKEVEERKRADAALRQSQSQLSFALRASCAGVWSWDVAAGAITWSPEYYDLYGLDPSVPPNYGNWMASIDPEDRGRVDAMTLASLEQRHEDINLEFRVLHPRKGLRWLQAIGRTAYADGHPTIMAGITLDITGRKQAESEREAYIERLKVLTHNLARSNEELEQFAYIATHDLREPLRMVSSFLELIERRYKGRLDKDADEFIGFAVDGAEYMQKLIRDLRSYSEIGKSEGLFAPVDLNTALTRASDNLRNAIEENRAEIIKEKLPSVNADEVQMVQLFQNLIENALKFRGDADPRIRISAEQRGDEWVISVHDNSIGIAPEYFDRIFQIFKRLHTRDKYPGTGAGLAICKKIVERHGGRIWVESEKGKGAVFYFTIPDKR